MAYRFITKATLANICTSIYLVCSGINSVAANTPDQPAADESFMSPLRLAELALGICQSGDADTGLLQSFINQNTEVNREPILFRQTEIGTKVSVNSATDNSLILEIQFLNPPGRAAQTSITSYLRHSSITDRVNPHPDTRLSLTDDCSIRTAHQMIYGDGTQRYIIQLDSNLQPTGDRQWLNPDVPELVSSVRNSETPGNELPDSGARDIITVGLVDSGVNYLLPEIANGLATDDQGNLTGYDFWDMDNKPFDANPARSPFFVQRHGTRTASIVLREAPGVKLAPYRYPRNNMSRMIDLVKHASAQGIKVIGMPLGSNTYDDWVSFESAASQHPDILFIVSAGNNGRDIDRVGVYPAAMDIKNMLVVTSADDFVHPAERTNYGRLSVDYLVPAEQIDAIDFNGNKVKVSGSSYAVARMLALAARLLQQAPEQSTEALAASIQQLSTRAETSRFVSIGYLGDPLTPTDMSEIDISIGDPGQFDDAQEADYIMPLQLVRLDHRWSYAKVADAVKTASQLYQQCNIALQVETVASVINAGYLSDLSSGHALTLYRVLKEKLNSSATRVFLAKDTIMQEQYDANAFGIGNTRNRPWMTNSLWLTYGIRDTDIALAHELFHIASNSGEHSTLAGNLMQGRTLVDNVNLTKTQCDAAIRQGIANGILRKRH